MVVVTMPDDNSKKSEETKPPNALRAILSLRNFRLLWVGESISIMGDQFFFIALPWLVIVLTGDALVLGTVLALAAVPRAVFILVGGAVTDRISPRLVMILSNMARLTFVLLFAVFILMGIIEMWMVYIFALAFGLGDAFFYPAQMAIIPQVVKKAQLQVANSLVMGMSQIAMFAGPVIAGVVIATFMSSDTDLTGIGYALLIDAMTFFASLIALALIRIRKKKEIEEETMIESIKKGLAYVWGDKQFRAVILVIFVIHFLIMGPMIVGIPVIADSRLAGAVSFGIVMTAFGGGSLLGIALSGATKPPRKSFGPLLLLITAVMGFGIFSIAFLFTTALVALVALTMGAANGVIMIWGITWFQSRTDESMMGRMMSLVMFSGAGIAPVSMAVSGFLIDWNLEWMYIGMGTALIIFTLGMATTPYVRRMKFDLDEVVAASKK